MNTEKLCKKCNEVKCITLFSKHPTSADRLQSFCRTCKNNYGVAWRNENRQYLKSKKPEVQEYNKAYRIKNRNKLLQSKKDYYNKNKKRWEILGKLYRSENKEYIRLSKQRYKKNRMQTDIGYRLRENIRSRTASAIRNKNKRKPESITKCLGCTSKILISHLEAKFTSGMNWDNYGKWHVDHIIPLSKFDLSNIDELKRAAHYTNLQPLWAVDNIRKSNKI